MPHPEKIWVVLDELGKPLDASLDRDDLVARTDTKDVIALYWSQDSASKVRAQERSWFLELMERLGYDLADRERIQEYFDRRK